MQGCESKEKCVFCGKHGTNRNTSVTILRAPSMSQSIFPTETGTERHSVEPDHFKMKTHTSAHSSALGIRSTLSRLSLPERGLPLLGQHSLVGDAPEDDVVQQGDLLGQLHG